MSRRKKMLEATDFSEKMIEKEAAYPTSFKIDFEGQPHEGACYYRITRCPICAYCKKIGAEEVMPLLCELDNVMIRLRHGVLHREQTIAGDGYRIEKNARRTWQNTRIICSISGSPA